MQISFFSFIASAKWVCGCAGWDGQNGL